MLSAPGRAVDLQVRVSAPVTGSGLPVILLSHGHGNSNNLSSLNGCAPLANFWAAHGFAVIQPTHLDSKTLSLNPDDPEAPLYWRSRAEDMKRILDQLDVIEAAVPQLPGRLDPSKVAVAGYSVGGHTASLLLGARLTDPRDGTEVNLAEPRITAGVLLAAPGRGGDAVLVKHGNVADAQTDGQVMQYRELPLRPYLLKRFQLGRQASLIGHRTGWVTLRQRDDLLALKAEHPPGQGQTA